MHADQVESNKARFLLDTGADVSLLKSSKLKKGTYCYYDNKLSLKGIDTETHSLTTLCYCYADINVNGTRYKQIFHIVEDNFPINCDGIIGNDFLKRVNAKIDYESDVLNINNDIVMLTHVQVPMTQHVNTHNQNVFTIKPRCETIIPIEILNPEMKEGIVDDVTILEGVYLCPSIVTVNSRSIALTSLLNTTDKSVKISKIQVTLTPIARDTNSNIECYSQSTNANSDRLNKITKALRTDHLNTEERESLISICHEFNNVFHLEDDTLTHVEGVMHAIPTTTQAPINTKNYRYPESHKHEVNRQITDMLEQCIIEPSSSPWNSPVWVVPKKLDASGQCKWRVVIDYRKLNDVTIGDSYPLPNVSEILDQLGHSKYFTTLDLTSGFHQIKIDPNDATKTAFSTPLGHFQFNRMPFGLKNAPATFQRMMDNVLSGLQGTRCFVYLDDIVVYSDTLDNHATKLREVLKRLSDFNLKLQVDKCEFLKKDVMYLGHLITENGVKPDPEKIKVVKEFPIPLTAKEIKSFLGFAGYYRRFIPNFSHITQPLTKLLKKDAPFMWTSLQQDAFERLKTSLCSEPILQYPDFKTPFNLTTDASNFAIGGVLSQGEIGKDLPIAYASRTLNKAESNYSTIEKELLAIVWTIKHFRPYLYGRKFNIITDHKPLTWLFNVKDPGSRLVRWRLKLEEYDYAITYKPGKFNLNADALSRIKDTQTNVKNVKSHSDEDTYSNFLKKLGTTLLTYDKLTECSDSLLNSSDNLATCISADIAMSEGIEQEFKTRFKHDEFLNSQQLTLHDVSVVADKDRLIYYLITKLHFWDKCTYEALFNVLVTLKHHLIKHSQHSISIPKLGCGFDRLRWNKVRSMIRYVFRNTDIKVSVYQNLILNPSAEEIPKILEEYHSNPSSGHSGFHRTYNRIKERYKWHNMKKDINKFIKTCESCQKNKLLRKKHCKPMELTTTSTVPLEKVFLDIVGPLPLTESGNKYILTLQDDLTKYSQAYALPNHEALTIAQAFVQQFICNFGLPKSILTDQGKEFTSKLLREVAKLFKIKQIQCSAYHPQSNGALERSHTTLADYLKHYVNDSQTTWDEWLAIAMFSYNTTIHTTTQYTPYELVFGYKPEIPSSLKKAPEFKYTYDDYRQDLILKLQKSSQVAKENAMQSKVKNKQYYDRKINNYDFTIGDSVYLQNEQPKVGRSKKLSPHYSGPYIIADITSPVNCTLLIRNKRVVVHTNRLKPAFVSGC